MCAVHFGDIVIVKDLLDPQGRNPKDRRAVVLTKDGDLERGEPIVVAGITSRLQPPLGPEFVELPWQNPRHPKTGCTKRCAVMCSWLAVVNPAAIITVSGRVPGRHLITVAEKTREAMARVLGPDWLEPEAGNKPPDADGC